MDQVKVNSWKAEGRDENDILALVSLSPDGFKIWENSKSESVFYTKVDSIQYPGCSEIYRFADQVEPRRIIGPTWSCNCAMFIENGSMCPHIFKYSNGVYSGKAFAQRYHRKMAVKAVPRVSSTNATEVDLHEQHLTSFPGSNSTNDLDVPQGVFYGLEDQYLPQEDGMDGSADVVADGDHCWHNNNNLLTQQTNNGPKPKKLTYVAVMNLMKPFAELVSNVTVANQGVLVSGFNGLVIAATFGFPVLASRFRIACRIILLLSLPTTDHSTDQSVNGVQPMTSHLMIQVRPL